jgi:hypothetical protein
LKIILKNSAIQLNFVLIWAKPQEIGMTLWEMFFSQQIFLKIANLMNYLEMLNKILMIFVRILEMAD